jgi:hypothetical protein
MGKINKHEDDSKIATNHIKIIKELSWHEVLDLVNIGKNNTGNSNSGHRNSGDSNSGNRNSGDSNSGYSNSGNRNSGDSNSGNRNSGDSNSGNRNSGYRNSGYSNSGYRNSGYSNSGDSNSGHFNSCDFSSGIFNSKESTILCFNKKSKLKYKDWLNHPAYNILSNFQLTIWVFENEMSEKEKDNNPGYIERNGFLKKYEYKEAWKILWDSLSTEDKKTVQMIPNFNKNVFFEITGIKIKGEKKNDAR